MKNITHNICSSLRYFACAVKSKGSTLKSCNEDDTSFRVGKESRSIGKDVQANLPNHSALQKT